MFAVLTLVVVGLISGSHAAGAGRAFPIDSENYIIEHFQRINPSIEWDPTNYLVDKSGEFANCAQIRRGYEVTNQVTPYGQTIGVLYDHLDGRGTDVESVNSYIMTIVNNWVDTRVHDKTIRNADRFGCSVRPGCKGVVTVACLVSPGRYGQGDDPEYSGWSNTPTITKTNRPTTRRPKTPRPTTHRHTQRTTSPTSKPIKQYGQAFTQEQYDVAEYITGKRWDRSHFLENLSGVEITCAMIDTYDWSFSKATKVAREYGMEVSGLKGASANRGSTQKAMEEVLKQFKKIQAASKVGCSLIPDCTTGRGDLGDEMFVLVVCLYEELY